nr:uncharacterized protein LOC112423802 [Macaca nemestrina]
MCLLTNERRAPARTARPPLRLRRPAAARCQVAGEGAAARGAGGRAGGRREARAAGLRPSERSEGAGSGHFSDSLYLRGKEGKKERRKETRKEGTVSMEGSGGGALALRVHRPQSGSGSCRLDPRAWRRICTLSLRDTQGLAHRHVVSECMVRKPTSWILDIFLHSNPRVLLCCIKMFKSVITFGAEPQRSGRVWAAADPVFPTLNKEHGN